MTTSMQPKPLIMNGSEIYGGLKIKRRVDSEDGYDIYSLENSEDYLYVFRDIEKDAIFGGSKHHEVISVETLIGERPAVLDADFSRKTALKIRKDITELTGFESVAGMVQLKELLTNEVINPLRYPEKYRKFKVGIPSGVLLYGPPGCGKTYIVRKLAEELGYNFFEIKASDVGSSYIHGSVEKISRAFDRARTSAPSILFFDEIEGLVPERGHLSGTEAYKTEEVNQFLAELDNCGDTNVLVVGATNRPQLIDTAIMRSGRMDRKIFIPPPDLEARKELFKLYVFGRPASQDINYDHLAELTVHYVSSDIELIVEDAARIAIKEDLAEINQVLLEQCIERMPRSISPTEINYFDNLQKEIDGW